MSTPIKTREEIATEIAAMSTALLGTVPTGDLPLYQARTGLLLRLIATAVDSGDDASLYKHNMPWVRARLLSFLDEVKQGVWGGGWAIPIAEPEPDPEPPEPPHQPEPEPELEPQPPNFSTFAHFRAYCLRKANDTYIRYNASTVPLGRVPPDVIEATIKEWWERRQEPSQ